MQGRGTRAGWFPDPSARRPWATEEETAGDGGDAGPSVRAGAGGVGGGATALRPLSVRGIRMRPAHPGAADSAFVTFAPVFRAQSILCRHTFDSTKTGNVATYTTVCHRNVSRQLTACSPVLTGSREINKMQNEEMFEQFKDSLSSELINI